MPTTMVFKIKVTTCLSKYLTPTTMLFFVSFSILLIYDNIGLLMLRFCHSLPMHVQVKEIRLPSQYEADKGFPKNSQGKCAVLQN